MERKKNKCPARHSRFSRENVTLQEKPVGFPLTVQNEYRNLIQDPWVPAFLPLEDMPGAQPPDDKNDV